jgi:hypothetical protein
MTSEGLEEVFEGDSADTCAGKFPLVSMGGRGNGQACADGERGPPSARAEICYSFQFQVPQPIGLKDFYMWTFYRPAGEQPLYKKDNVPKTYPWVVWKTTFNKLVLMSTEQGMKLK